VGEPAAEILEVAKEAKVDLIVVGTHGRTGLEHALMGSIAERVVRRAHCPVLTVRPQHR
jgi:nucleotide-binding universal stress UspA family protein